MTRKEAIKILNKYDLNFCDINGNPIPPQDLAEAFDMAIQALQQQTCDNCKFNEETDGMNCYECVKGISDNFEALEQEPKREKWEHYLKEGLKWKCSGCGSRYTVPWSYCPNCGARMETEQ